jgi:hypothetical protein
MKYIKNMNQKIQSTNPKVRCFKELEKDIKMQ